MKIINVILMICCFSPLLAQPEVGAFNYGKYDFGLTAEYRLEGGLRLGAKIGYRNFNGPLNRPINYSANLSTGLSTFHGETQLSGDIGAYQVYANGNDAQNGFGIGTGLRLSVDCYGAAHDLRLQATVNPGLYNFNSSYSLSAVGDIFSVSLDDEIKEEDKIEFFSDPKIGYTLDWQNTKRLGVVQYGYLNLSQEEKEDMDEENAKEEEKKERDWRLGLHLHKSF